MFIGPPYEATFFLWIFLTFFIDKRFPLRLLESPVGDYGSYIPLALLSRFPPSKEFLFTCLIF
jgi:hypothetical protein